MSRSMNKVTLIGNVGSDPECRSVPGGGRVAQFSLATSRTWNDQNGAKQEKTEWHRCVAWNGKGAQNADIIERYVKKGDKLCVEGRIEYRSWQDKDGQTRYTTEINVREVLLLGGGNGHGGEGEEDEEEGEDTPPVARGNGRRSARGSGRGRVPAGSGARAEEFDDDFPG